MNVKCKCRHCDGKIEFSSADAGRELPCPHCGLETQLFIPPGHGYPPPPAKSTPKPPPQPTPPLNRTEKPAALLSNMNLELRVIASLLVTGALVFFFYNSVVTRVLPPPAWEYKTLAIPDENLTEHLNALGAEGWEIVTARRAGDATGIVFSYEIIFKRPKSGF